jgi:DNA replication protein DnaC
MSRIHAVCTQPNCGREMSIEIDGDVGRWAAMIARRTICDECAERLEREEFDRERAQELDARRRVCWLPPTLRGVTFDSLDDDTDQRALDAVRSWVAKPRGLMLTGEIGVGKTTLAAAACWSLLSTKPCRYLRGSGVMSVLGKDFADPERRRLVKLLGESTAIVLDDIDKMRSSDFGRERLFDAIDSRLQAGTPILVTTNLMPSELGQRFGDSIKSRLTGDYFRVVKVGGGDRRLAASRRLAVSSEPAGQAVIAA